jgi:hypothetical protein
MNIYAMKQFWFKTMLGVLITAALGTGAFQLPKQAGAYQGAPTPTGVFVTVANPPDGTNVRSGPSSVSYGAPIGHLNPGETAIALGKSTAGEWIQIEFPAGPNRTGWVYSANVEVSPGYLPIVEPPPTPAPLATSTIDPTLAAAFNIQPTQTRLPTFTPPPPLEVVEIQPAPPSPGVVPGFLILGLGLLGGLGLLVSFLLRK